MTETMTQSMMDLKVSLSIVSCTHTGPHAALLSSRTAAEEASGRPTLAKLSVASRKANSPQAAMAKPARAAVSSSARQSAAHTHRW
jgi:hypothetical protein